MNDKRMFAVTLIVVLRTESLAPLGTFPQTCFVKCAPPAGDLGGVKTHF